MPQAGTGPPLGMAGPARIVTIGDAVIDVVALPDRTAVADDDVPARIRLDCGGQAANVAAWCTWLGMPATVVAATGADPAADLVRALLAARGVRVLGPMRRGSSGVVVSVVAAGGGRTLLSDRGASGRLVPADLRAEWFDDARWLFVSGYCLFGDDGGQAAVAAGRLAAQHGARISVDLSATTLVSDLGRTEVRRRLDLLGAELVFANDAEAEAAGDVGAATVVVKQGAGGHVVRSEGRSSEGPVPASVSVVDTTGAGDAFAAGWMVGGPSTAQHAAEACIRRLGAAPPAPSAPGARADRAAGGA